MWMPDSPGRPAVQTARFNKESDADERALAQKYL